ncbi:hypothetical protein BDZ45DRAFT_740867 [Acephala macrosclerotiorum]|nr:hypothetical protein BDZ45DRAFT_740867 [Acephala macrosclerotiorum]
MVGVSPFAPPRPKKMEKVLTRLEVADVLTPKNANDPNAMNDSCAGNKHASKKSQRITDALNMGKKAINIGKSLFDRLKGKPKPDNNPYPSLRQTQKVGKQEVGVVVGTADGGASREESLRSKTPVVKEHAYQPLKSNPLTLSEVEFINATRAKALAELEGTTNASGSTIDLRSRLETREEVGTSEVGASAAPATSTESQEHVQNRVMADIVIDRTLAAFEERQAARAKGQKE